jgi:hypothetical protein
MRWPRVVAGAAQRQRLARDRAGMAWPFTIDSVSMSQAMTRPSVLTSGAGMSTSGPSSGLICAGVAPGDPLQLTQRQGAGIAAHAALGAAEGQVQQRVNVIMAARALTSSASTSRWKRMPPLPGPRVVSWWTHPLNTSTRRPAAPDRHLQHALGCAACGARRRRAWPAPRLRRVVEDSLPGPGTHRRSLFGPASSAAPKHAR